MATSGGIEFNDDDIDPELDLDSQGDMEGSFDELPPEATDFDVSDFEGEPVSTEKSLNTISDEQIAQIEDNLLTKILSTLNKENVEDVTIENIVEAPDNLPTVQEPTTDLKNIGTIEKTISKELTKLTKEAKQELANTKKELAKQQRREIQDEKRAVRREKRGLTTDATRRRTDINSDATSAKIATYSLAAAAGLPGYLVASIVNRLLIEPAADKDIEAERTYSDQLVEYYNDQEDALIDKQREFEDERDALTTPDFDPEEVGKFLESKSNRPSTSPVSKSKNQPASTNPKNTPTNWPKGFDTWSDPVTSTTPTPTEPPDVNKVVEDLTKLVNPPSTTTPTSTPTYPLPQPSSASGITQPPPAIAPPGQPPGGTPPVINTPGVPGGGQPAIPTRGFNPAIATKAIPMLTAVIEGGKLLRDTAINVGQGTKKGIEDLYQESPVNALSNGMKTFTENTEVFGISPFEGLNQAVQVFATSVDQFGKYVDKDVAYSPETLGVSVEGSIDKLLKNMEIAERLDPQKAALKESMNQLDLIWSEFKAEFFSKFAPYVARMLDVIAHTLSILKGILDTVSNVLSSIYLALTYLPGIGAILSKLVKNTTKQSNKANSLAKELEQFHDPTNFPIAPKNLNIRRRP